MTPGFQIAAGAYSSYVTKAIWKGIRSRFHFGMGISQYTAQNWPCLKNRKHAQTAPIRCQKKTFSSQKHLNTQDAVSKY